MEVCIRRILGNRIPEVRHALATIGENPAPKVELLGRSSQRSPRAPEEREVQQDNGVCGMEPHLKDIVSAKISIEDPAILLNQALL